MIQKYEINVIFLIDNEISILQLTTKETNFNFKYLQYIKCTL